MRDSKTPRSLTGFQKPRRFHGMQAEPTMDKGGELRTESGVVELPQPAPTPPEQQEVSKEK